MLFVYHVILLQDILPILIISKINDLSLWCEIRHFRRLGSYICGNTQQFFCVADSGHTSIRNRTELQFCQQMNQTWINENKKPKTLFMLVVCLVVHLALGSKDGVVVIALASHLRGPGAT